MTRGIYEKSIGSGVWWVRFADSTGKIRREKAGTKAAAKQLYAIRKAAVLQKQKLPHTLKTKPVTFLDLSKLALDYAVVHKRSAADDQERMKVLVDLFGDLPADNMKPKDIEKRLMQEAADRKWKPATVNRYKALLSLAFRIGVENGKVSDNPARLVRRLKEDTQVIRYLADAEEKRLREAVEPAHPERWAAIQFALNTGVRAGEQKALKWRDVTFDAGQAQVTLVATKNGALRHLPLNSAARIALNALKGSKKPNQPVFPQQPYRGWFDIALDAAKVENFTWHCLRHTFASRLVMKGVDIRTVAELLGHKTLQMTMRYAHLAPEHKAAAVEKLVAIATDTKTDTSHSEANTPAEVGKVKSAVGTMS